MADLIRLCGLQAKFIPALLSGRPEEAFAIYDEQREQLEEMLASIEAMLFKVEVGRAVSVPSAIQILNQHLSHRMASSRNNQMSFRSARI